MELSILLLKEAVVTMRLTHAIGLATTLGVSSLSLREGNKQKARLLTLQLAYYFVYQLYFHPLAKYPGPLLAKVSILPAAYKAWRGDLHIDIWQQHQRYGIWLCSLGLCRYLRF